MSLYRSFSFDRDDHDPQQDLYHSDYPQQTHSRGQGYQVASGTSYIPAIVPRSPSPELSQMSSYAYPPGYSFNDSHNAMASRPLPPPPPSHSHSYHDSITDVPPPPRHMRSMSPASNHTMDNSPYTRGHIPQQDSFSSSTGLAVAAAAPAVAAHRDSYVSGWPNDHRADLGMGYIDPNSIDDDGDDDFAMQPRDRSRSPLPPAGAVAASGATRGARDASGSYGQVPAGADPEKSAWLKHETGSSKKLKWMVGGLIALVIVLAVAGGVIGAVITSKKKGSSSSASAADDDGTDLTKDSSEIKALMNNKDLHKVFPGMDYTPLNAQYPDCIHNPPSQNNITRDLAVLSQLTDNVRLYGTDCNQTEMVLHSINNLGLKSTMKVWLGVWIDKNQTTSDRQLTQMYSLLSENGADPFAGVIVGNEVLFRKDLSETQLTTLLTNVKSNLTSMGINLPLATSDLGSSWTTSLTQAVDVVMSNVHPFFGGVPADQSAGWTWSFWQNNDVVLTANDPSKKQVISEVGWPSEGGNDCGVNDATNTAVTCADSSSGAVAGIDEMNRFMNDFVCQSLTNGTDYFWFEAFDEPWKIVYNTPTQQWEDKWGLMDVNRNLKDGVKIPDCGGQTASRKI